MSRRDILLDEMVRRGQIAATEAVVTMPIIVDDLVEYHNRCVDNGRNITHLTEGQVIRTPYARTWLEARADTIEMGTYKSTGQEVVINGAHLLVAMDCMGASGPSAFLALKYMVESRGQSVPRTREHLLHDSPNAVLITTYVRMPALNTAPRWFFTAFVPCDEEWRRSRSDIALIAPSDVSGPLSPRDDKRKITESAADTAFCWATIGIHALAMFHVKNVEVVSVSNRAERRQAALRGRVGIVVRELIIAPFRRSLHAMRQAERDNPGQPLPYHLCRGHFKTFTEAAPLLGRFSGTFWWEPHWRGSEHMGVVLHDRAELRIPADAVTLGAESMA